jgi:hypothetical protein
MTPAETAFVLIAKSCFYLAALVYPGWVVLRLLHFQSSHWADRVLATLSTGMAYLGLSIFVLGYAGIYTRAMLIVLLALPLLAHWRFARSASTIQKQQRPPAAPRQTVFEKLNGIVIILISAHLSWIALQSLTQPYRMWDALVSWDKWAVDWATHSSVAHYLFGSYTQLLPMLHSIPYKLARSADAILPHETFVNHAVHTFWSVLLLIALYRLALLWHAAAWFATLSFFGWYAVQAMIPSGYTDILAAAGSMTALALTVGRQQGAWTCSRAEWTVLGSSYFIAMAAKLPAIVWVALATVLGLSRRNSLSPRPRTNALPARQILFGAGLALAPIIFFVGHQIYLNATFDGAKTDPLDHMFTFQSVRLGTQSHMQAEVANTNTLERLQYALSTLFVPGQTIFHSDWVIAALVFLGLIGAVWDRRLHVPLLFILVYTGIYLYTSAYDIRNLIVAVALTSAVSARGFEIILGVCSAVPRKTLTVILACFCILSWAKSAYSHAFQNPPAPAAWSDRLETIGYEPAAKAAAFFPEFAPDLAVLSSTQITSQAAHIITTSPMYRLVPRGIYSLRELHWPVVRPGDLFISSPPYRPPARQDWILLWEPKQRIWVSFGETNRLAPIKLSTTGVNPPLFVPGGSQHEVEFRGEQSYLAYAIPSEYLQPGSSFVWRFRIEEQTPTTQAFYLTSFGSKINVGIQPNSLILRNDPIEGTNEKFSTGMLTLAPGLSIRQSTDYVIVGITSSLAGHKIKLKDVHIGIYAAGPNSSGSSAHVAASGAMLP